MQVSLETVSVFTLELNKLYSLAVILLDCFQLLIFFVNNVAINVLRHVSGLSRSWIVGYAHLP